VWIEEVRSSIKALFRSSRHTPNFGGGYVQKAMKSKSASEGQDERQLLYDTILVFFLGLSGHGMPLGGIQRLLRSSVEQFRMRATFNNRSVF